MPPAKTIVTTAAIALLVTIAYEKHSTGKLPKLGR
jgi:hypothetical protein